MMPECRAEDRPYGGPPLRVSSPLEAMRSSNCDLRPGEFTLPAKENKTSFSRTLYKSIYR